MGATSRCALLLSGRRSATITLRCPVLTADSVATMIGHLRGRVIPKPFDVVVCSISTSGSIPERLLTVEWLEICVTLALIRG